MEAQLGQRGRYHAGKSEEGQLFVIPVDHQQIHEFAAALQIVGGAHEQFLAPRRLVGVETPEDRR
jgi:hypothetical protein